MFINKSKIFMYFLLAIAVIITVICFELNGKEFKYNFLAEVVGILFGAVFTYFIVDNANEQRDKHKWQHLETEIKTNLHYFFVQSTTGILQGQEYKALFCKKSGKTLSEEAFGCKISSDYKDFMPKTKKLCGILKHYYDNPNDVIIDENAVVIYANARIDKYEVLKPNIYDNLHLLYWLNDLYDDFSILETDVKHLKLDGELYQKIEDNKEDKLDKTIKAKKQYILSVLIFLNKLIEFEEKYKLYRFVEEKAKNRRKLAKKDFVIYKEMTTRE